MHDPSGRGGNDNVYGDSGKDSVHGGGGNGDSDVWCVDLMDTVTNAAINSQCGAE